MKDVAAEIHRFRDLLIVTRDRLEIEIEETRKSSSGSASLELRLYPIERSAEFSMMYQTWQEVQEKLRQITKSHGIVASG
jgi:hypothetical protein